MKNILIKILLIFIGYSAQAQSKKEQEVYLEKRGDHKIIVRIIEVTDKRIIYVERHMGRDANHIDTVNKSDVASAYYKKTKEDYFKNNELKVEAPIQLKRGNKAFVVSIDNGAIIHGQDALRGWGYWQVVDKQDDADIIVNFKIHHIAMGMGIDFKGYIEVSDAKTHKVLLETESLDSSFKGGGFNGKLKVCEGLVNKRLIPMIEGLQ